MASADVSESRLPTYPQRPPRARSLPFPPRPSSEALAVERDGPTQSAAPRCAIGGLRQKALFEGVEALADAELVHLVLCHAGALPSARRVASRLLLEQGGLREIGRLSPQGFVTRQGVPAATAVVLAAALELGRRSLSIELGGARPGCGSFDAVVAWARPRLGPLDHEEFWVLGLDGRNALKTMRCVARGGQHGCALTTRDILRPILTDGATAVVVVHNHPSGDPTPSADDAHMTRALAAACDTVGTPLLDHVIITRTDATSLLELGILG